MLKPENKIFKNLYNDYGWEDFSPEAKTFFSNV